MKKRIISVLISAVLIISFATTAFAAGNTSNGSEKSDVAADYMSALEGEEGDTVGDEDKQPSKRIEIGEDGAVCLYDENNAPISGFVKIGEYWYYGDSEGKAVVGLQKIGNGMYYFDASDYGKMLTGIQQINGNKYLFKGGDSGRMLYGWQQVDEKYYYFEPSTGIMKIGWVKVGKNSYYCDEDGVMVTGFKKIDGAWYMFNGGNSGRLLYGWLKSGAYKYYADPSTGKIVTGWQKIDGKWYLFRGGDSGRMLTGWQTVGGQKYYMDPSTGVVQTGFKKIDGSWYYLKTGDSGRMLTGWQKVNGAWYYMEPSTGKMVTDFKKIDGSWYYFRTGDSGRMMTGWQKINGAWYYMNTSNGKMVTGFQKIGGSWYYFKTGDSGRMMTGWQTIGGKKYYFNSSGKMLTGWQYIDGAWSYFKGGNSGQLLKGPLAEGGTVTAMGITVPVDTRRTDLHMEEVSEFTGHLSQDGSWKWIEASQTTPQRGDIVVYYNPHEQYYAASHVCVCVTDYNGKVYKAVDGNYGDGDGKVRSGYGTDETPNKGWPDSFQDEKDGYQNKETAMGVWRSEKYAEQMASAAEDVLAEFKSVGQYTWLEMYIPESYYGSWCYYLIPAVVAMAAR